MTISEKIVIWHPFFNVSWLIPGIWHLCGTYSCSESKPTLIYRFWAISKFCYLTHFYGYSMTQTWNMTPESVLFVFSFKKYPRYPILSDFKYFCCNLIPFFGRLILMTQNGIWHLRVSFSCSVLKTTLVYQFWGMSLIW